MLSRAPSTENKTRRKVTKPLKVTTAPRLQLEPRSTFGQSELSTNSLELAGDNGRILMDTVSLQRSKRLEELRMKYPMMPDAVLTRAPSQLALSSNPFGKSSKLTPITRPQIERIENEVKERVEKLYSKHKRVHL